MPQKDGQQVFAFEMAEEARKSQLQLLEELSRAVASTSIGESHDVLVFQILSSVGDTLIAIDELTRKDAS